MNGGDLLKPTEWWGMIHVCKDYGECIEQEGKESEKQLGACTLPQLRLIKQVGDTCVVSLCLQVQIVISSNN